MDAKNSDSVSQYVFEGERIKLKANHFNQMKERYSKLNLMEELLQLDLELQQTKSWWMPMHAKLNYRNKNIKSFNAQSGNQQNLDSWINEDNVIEHEQFRQTTALKVVK